jgi:YidC/Oxa1 family membrane protein insertase
MNIFEILVGPFVVIILGLYQLFAQNLGLAIIFFTVLVRAVIFPLTYQQMKSAKNMQAVSPKLSALREKYKDPKDREKLARAQMDLYRDHGVNPLAGCFPLIIQMPILLGLYGAVNSTLGATPLQLLDVNSRLLVPAQSVLFPLQTRFLWLDLGVPDQFFILPVLVMATTWLQMRMTVPPPVDPKDPTAAVSKQMVLIMPLMIGFFSLSFASGLSVYWVVGNILGILQYVLMGRVDLRTLRAKATVLPTLANADGGKEMKEIEVKGKPEPAGKATPALAAKAAGNTSSPARTVSKRKLSETKFGEARKKR